MKKDNDLYIGKKMKLKPAYAKSVIGVSMEEDAEAYVPCEVISINEEHRYFRVRFDCPNGESFTEARKFCRKKDLAPDPKQGLHTVRSMVFR